MKTNATQNTVQAKFIDTFERKEKKYVLDEETLARFMQLVGDRFGDDQYAHSTISSLYYDTPQFSMINRSIEKPLYKEKLRIRCYDVPSDEAGVFVELKKKFKGIVYKRRIRMSIEGGQAYLEGTPYSAASLLGSALEAKDMDMIKQQNIREIDACLSRHGNIAPAIMIIVERHSIRSNDGSNIRITFDRNARWRAHNLRFDEGFQGTPIFSDDTVIMEVKALGTYPLWLVHALDQVGAYPVSCSKVGLAYKALCTAKQPEYMSPRQIQRRLSHAHAA